MIPILRVLVLCFFLILAFILAFRKERYQISYYLILAFVAVGATTLLPEATLLNQGILAAVIFTVFALILHCIVRARLSDKEQEEKKRANRKI